MYTTEAILFNISWTDEKLNAEYERLSGIPATLINRTGLECRAQVEHNNYGNRYTKWQTEKDGASLDRLVMIREAGNVPFCSTLLFMLHHQSELLTR